MREEKPQGFLIFLNREFPATCCIYGYIISLHQDAVNTFAEVSILDLVQLLFSVVIETWLKSLLSCTWDAQLVPASASPFSNEGQIPCSKQLRERNPALPCYPTSSPLGFLVPQHCSDPSGSTDNPAISALSSSCGFHCLCLQYYASFPSFHLFFFNLFCDLCPESLLFLAPPFCFCTTNLSIPLLHCPQLKKHCQRPFPKDLGTIPRNVYLRRHVLSHVLYSSKIWASV